MLTWRPSVTLVDRMRLMYATTGESHVADSVSCTPAIFSTSTFRKYRFSTRNPAVYLEKEEESESSRAMRCGVLEDDAIRSPRGRCDAWSPRGRCNTESANTTNSRQSSTQKCFHVRLGGVQAPIGPRRRRRRPNVQAHLLDAVANQRPFNFVRIRQRRIRTRRRARVTRRRRFGLDVITTGKRRVLSVRAHLVEEGLGTPVSKRNEPLGRDSTRVVRRGVL